MARILCTEEGCIHNVEDEDETNIYRRRCECKEIEIYYYKDIGYPVCFTRESK